MSGGDWSDRTDRAALDAAAGVLTDGGADEQYQGVLADFAKHGWGENELRAAARALVRIAEQRGEVTR